MKRVWLIGVVAAAVAVVGVVMAQPTGGMPERPRGVAQQSPEDPPTVTVDFKGGSLAEYVAAVRAAQPAVNVVYTTEAERFPVPAILLRDAAEFEVMGVLNLLRMEGSSRLNVENKGRVFAISVINAGARAGGSQTSVWSVQELLANGIKPEDLLSAVDVAVEVGGGNSAVKFHRETALLIARGDGGDLVAIDALIQQLHRGQQARPSLTQQIDAIRVELESLAAQVQALQDRTRAAQP